MNKQEILECGCIRNKGGWEFQFNEKDNKWTEDSALGHRLEKGLQEMLETFKSLYPKKFARDSVFTFLLKIERNDELNKWFLEQATRFNEGKKVYGWQLQMGILEIKNGCQKHTKKK